MPNVATEPTTTVCISEGVPKIAKTVTEAMKPVRLVIPSTSTYGNGVALGTAQYGKASGQGTIWLTELPAIHPQSNTPWDKDTDFAVKDNIDCVKMQVGKVYWLAGSSLTVDEGDKLIMAANGLIAENTNTTTVLPMHTWVVERDVSGATYVAARYMGLVADYTA